jgi:hypothetical protein
MPCCAFAAFILSQIIFGLAAIRNFVLGRPADSFAAPADNPATEWRLVPADTAATRSMRTSRRPRLTLSLRTIAIATSIEIVLITGSAYGIFVHRHHHHQEHRVGAPSMSAAGHVMARR